MGTPEQAMHRPVVEVRGPGQRMAWALWIIVSVIGAVVAALSEWQVRTFLGSGPAITSHNALYASTVVEALIASGAQWLVLRYYRLQLQWWVPVSVAANLLNAIVVIRTVLRLAEGAGMITPPEAIIAGAAALAAAGVVVGTAQALVLRGPAGNTAWAWIPATAIGGALAGAVTTAVSAQLFGLPYVTVITVLTATGALLIAASQGPVFLRVLR